MTTVDETQKIKLLIFTPTLECGGAEKYVSLLCNNIDTSKFDASLVVLNNSSPFYTISEGMEIIDMKTKRVRRSLFAIKKMIRDRKPQIVFTTANHLNLLFAIFRWMFPKKMLVIGWESSIVSINNRRASFPKLYNWLVKKYYRNLDHIICQSNYMRHDLVANYAIPENKTTVINMPVEKLTASTMVASVTEHHVYKFISVARLSEEKGLDRLIRSVARLSLPYKYHIIGEGDQRKILQRLIDELSLNGIVVLEGEKKYPYDGMEDADLMLMGSRYEGFPMVLLEAGMLGIPVIAFDAPGGIGEIVKPAENGLLVQDGDELAFANAIEAALQIKFNREKIITDTKGRYSLRKIVGETEELFERCLTQRR